MMKKKITIFHHAQIAFQLTPKTTIFHHTKNNLLADAKNQSRTVGNNFPFPWQETNKE